MAGPTGATGRAGPTGATGTQGPPGPGGVLSLLYAVSSTTGVVDDEPISFGAPTTDYGSDISEGSATVFDVTAPGIYQIEYALPTTAFSPLGDVEITLDGEAVGPVSTLGLAGTELTDFVDLDVTAAELEGGAATISLEATGLGLTLSAGGSLAIVKDA